MIFNFSAIGKKANDSIPLLIAKSDDAIAPTKITIEVSSNLLSAVVLDYPKSVNKEMARQAVNKIFANCEKKLSVQDVYVWRDEKNKIAIMVGEEIAHSNVSVRLIVRSIDKNVQGNGMWRENSK